MTKVMLHESSVVDCFPIDTESSGVFVISKVSAIVQTSWTILQHAEKEHFSWGLQRFAMYMKLVRVPALGPGYSVVVDGWKE